MKKSNLNLVHQDKINWYSVLQLTFSALAIVSLWILALVLVLVGIIAFFDSSTSSANSASLFIIAASFTAIGMLLLPSAGFAFFRLSGRTIPGLPSWAHKFRPSLLIFLFPIVIFVGYLVSEYTDLAWLILPILHVLAVGLPILWVLYMGVRNLPLGSPQRMWGVFGSGLVLGPGLIMFAEILVLVLIIFIGIFFIANRPGLVEELTNLSQWLITSNPTPEMVLERLSDYLINPIVLLVIITFGSIMVPLIEEAIKPIGVWLLWGRSLRGAAGFAAGAISGAGYALFESLSLTSSSQEWAIIVVARAATAVIHILTTALMGRALVLAWRKKKYSQLFFTYFGVVLIHGFWNGLTLFVAFTSIVDEQLLNIDLPSYILALGRLAPVGLIFITVGCFIALIMAHRSLSRGLSKRVSTGSLFEAA